MTVTCPVQVVAVDNLDVVRYGLLTLPMIRPDVVAAVRANESVDEIDLNASPPDVLVLDYWLGHEDSPVVDHLDRLREWATRIVLYTSEEHPARLQAAMRAGVTGLCLKTDGLLALADTIKAVCTVGTAFSGPLAKALLDDSALGARLTPRECEILEGLAIGLSISDIAAQLFLSEKTVQTHAENIRRKYASRAGRANRARVILEAQRDGYLPHPPRARA